MFIERLLYLCCLLVCNDGFGFARKLKSRSMHKHTQCVVLNIFIKNGKSSNTFCSCYNRCQKPGPVCYNDCFSLEKCGKTYTCLVSFTDNNTFPYSLAFK